MKKRMPGADMAMKLKASKRNRPTSAGALVTFGVFGDLAHKKDLFTLYALSSIF